MSAELLTRVRNAVADRYAIERELGQGGMATVYLARDLKHDRQVAVKVLRPELSAALGAERFHAEIRTTARLAHPHILALFDSGEADGMLYYVMPFVEGETLRTRLAREKTLPVDEALRIARAVSDALAYAHAREVVHRDIKPENILLQDGHPLVSDFGIARAVGAAGADRLTVTGLLLGTPLYMSPEQASGEVVIDGRSDVYSLACVLFEMLTGEAPFTGPTMQAVIAKRFSQPAPSAASKNRDVPELIDAALRRALARDPGERIESASRFTEMLAAAMIAAQEVARRGGKPAAPDTVPCIAVLPFANMSADQEAEFFSDGMSEEILNALAKLSGLRVIARTSSFAFKGKNVDVREIGKTLGAGHVLEGSVRKSGNKLRITTQLIDANTGHHLWSERYDREMTDVFAIQDEITAAIRDELSKRITGIGEAVARSTPEIDPATYEMYLRGWHLVERRIEGMHRGMEVLSEVTARAPAYAPAHSALASAYALLGFYCALPSRDAFGRARESAERAVTLDPNDPQGHAILGHAALFLDWDWAAADRQYRRARELAGSAPGTWAHAAGVFLACSLGQFELARQYARNASTRDPLNPSLVTTEVTAAIMAGRYDDAVAVCDRLIDFAPNYSEAYRHKAVALMDLGRLDEAERCMDDAVLLSKRHVWSVMNLVELKHKMGRIADADAAIAELEARARTEPIPPFAVAIRGIYGSRAGADRFFEDVAAAIEVRDFWLVMMRVERWPQWVRDDPRFEVACRRIGIPPLAS